MKKTKDGSNRHTGPANKSRKKKADDHAVEVYKKIERRIEAGASLSQLVQFLFDHEIYTRRGNEYTPSSVSRLIKRYRERHDLTSFLV